MLQGVDFVFDIRWVRTVKYLIFKRKNKIYDKYISYLFVYLIINFCLVKI